MTAKPMIGSYRKSSEEGNTPKTPSQNLAEGVQEEIKDSAALADPITKKALSYADILEAKSIEITKAHSIVDSMLEKGFYTDTLPVTKSVSVTLRTRTHNDYVRYLRALELHNPKFVAEQNELQIRYFLAASLVSFKGKSFEHPVPTSDIDKINDAFDVRLEWITQQPESIVNLLASKLSKFDEVIHTVMSEGVVENF